jgi:hypothetical protein
MGLSVDQQIQVWNAVGTWFAGLATFGAVVFSLFVLRRAEKVRLRVSVGLRLIVGGGEPRKEVVLIQVTNLGERAATIVNISWRVGSREHFRFAVQTFANISPSRPPVVIEHGQSAMFNIEVEEGDPTDAWLKSMVRLGDGRQAKQWDTLVCQVHTSVGQDVACKPERPLIDRIKQAQRVNA